MEVAIFSPCVCLDHLYRLGLLPGDLGASSVMENSWSSGGIRVSIGGRPREAPHSPKSSSLPSESLPSTSAIATAQLTPGKASWHNTLTSWASPPFGFGVSCHGETRLGLCSRTPNQSINLSHFPLNLG